MLKVANGIPLHGQPTSLLSPPAPYPRVTFPSPTDSPTLPTLKIAPIPEMYGNLLLAVPTPDAATALLLFQQCVQELPGRMQCVYGVARAAEMAAGTQELSGPAYALLLQQCGAAGDAAFPPLVRARQVLGAYPPPSPPPPQRRGGRRMAAL